jgi:hypothetical protein
MELVRKTKRFKDESFGYVRFFFVLAEMNPKMWRKKCNEVRLHNLIYKQFL